MKGIAYTILGFGESKLRSLIQLLSLEATARRPHLIMVYPGFNDSRRDGWREASNAVSIEQFRGLMGELVSGAKAVCETVVMTGFPFDEARTTPLSGTDSYYLLHDAEAYSNELVAIASAQDVHPPDRNGESRRFFRIEFSRSKSGRSLEFGHWSLVAVTYCFCQS